MLKNLTKIIFFASIATLNTDSIKENIKVISLATTAVTFLMFNFIINKYKENKYFYALHIITLLALSLAYFLYDLELEIFAGLAIGHVVLSSLFIYFYVNKKDETAAKKDETAAKKDETATAQTEQKEVAKKDEEAAKAAAATETAEAAKAAAPAAPAAAAGKKP